MSKVVELFGYTPRFEEQIGEHLNSQSCPFTSKRCYKVRKSSANISIGTCTVAFGRPTPEPIIICPTRMIEDNKIFTDCIHLLTNHEPGNELHIVSEVSIPGGSVDYFLVSARHGKVRDFVGIEIQTLDTTGSVWPERQRLLHELGFINIENEDIGNQSFGMNWKMTAKTILMQMHHKTQTFEHVNKKLVLVIQDKLLSYMEKEFRFSHLNSPAQTGDSMHIHAYSLSKAVQGYLSLSMSKRLSTDVEGVAECIGLQAEARVELAMILEALQNKISEKTLLRIGR